MLRSCSISNDKVEIFQLFIHRLLDGNVHYKKSIDNVLIETHKFANGESDVYSIDRANFDIILRLVKKAPEFFKDLDIENIREDDYKRILVLFEPDTSMIEN